MKELTGRGDGQLGRIINALSESEQMTLRALAATLEIRDVETHAHSERVVGFSLRLGLEMELHKEQMSSLGLGSLFHDIGKIGVPDYVLRKPARLTAEEWTKMREHPALGRQVLAGIGFLDGAARVVGQHHEQWDGAGYPCGLRGQEIDMNARIFAVADAFDAMTSDRVYRTGMTYEAACAELERCAGRQFDPEVVMAFSGIPACEWECAVFPARPNVVATRDSDTLH